MKKQLQLIIPVLFVISANLTGYGQQVEEKFTVGDIEYEITSLSPNQVSVYKYHGTATEVTIPGEVDNGSETYTVTAIGENNDDNTSTQPFAGKELTSVEIPETVTIIGLGAFNGKQLAEVTIPNSVTTIRRWAFSRNAYTELTIPANVVSIGEQAFYENNSLKLVTVEAINPPTLHPTAFQGSPLNLIDLVVPEVAIDEYKDPAKGWAVIFKSINIGVFTDNGIKYVVSSSSPPEVEISEYDVRNGTSVIIPSTVKDQDDIEYKVTAINNEAFSRKGLTSVIFADQSNVTRIDSAAFGHNTLTELTIPSSVTSIGDRAFWVEASPEDGLTRLTFVDQGELKFIGDKAFMNNKLTQLTIPSSVDSIANDAFAYNALTEVTFSTSSELTHINEGVFKANNLTSVTIPGRVESIGLSAFSANRELIQVTLPGSVTSIGPWAFDAMPLGGTVRIEATNPPSLVLNSDGRGEPFGDHSLIAVDVPRSALEDYHTDDDWTRTSFRSIGIFTDKDIKYGITDVTTNEAMVIDYTGSAAGVDIPGTVNDNNDNNETYTVTSIGQQAFKDNQLTEVTLPNTVTHIGGFAFANNQLNSVTLPVGVTRIDSVAFIDNPNLAMVMVERNDPPGLHADAFQNPGRDQIDVIVPRGTPAGSIKTDYEAAEWTGFASLEEGITLSIEGASEVESLSPFDMTFNFIREVTGFTINDISVNHAATLSDFTGDGSSYTVKVTPTTCEGVIEITVPGDVAEYTPDFLSLAASAKVTVNATPSAPAVSSPSVEYCVGETADALTATGDNLLWYTTATGGTGEAAAPIPNTANAEETSYYVSQTTNSCESGRAEIVVIVEACPAQVGDVFTVSGMDYEITSVNPNEVKVMDYISSATAVKIPGTVDDKGETYTVTAIGANAFREKQLTEVTIPNSVTSIGDGAFVDNTDLDLVTVEATHPPSLHENAFTDRGQIDLVVPAGTGIREDYLNEGWTGFKSISDGTVVLSIGEPGKDNFILYPNPARDKVYIALGSGQELKQVNIYTMIEGYLYSENGPEINTSRLPRGTYLFEIVTKKGDRSMRRVIIQ